MFALWAGQDMINRAEFNFSRFGAREYGLSLVQRGAVRELVPLVLGEVYGLVNPLIVIVLYYLDRHNLKFTIKEKAVLLRKNLAISSMVTFPVLYIVGSLITIFSAYQNAQNSSVALQLAMRNIFWSDLGIGIIHMVCFWFLTCVLTFPLVKRLNKGVWVCFLWFVLVVVINKFAVIACNRILTIVIPS